MEYSGARVHLGRFAALVGLDIVGRLTLPGALLALAAAQHEVAVVGSLVSTAASSLRAFVIGDAVDRALQDRWRMLVDAIRGRSLVELRTYREDRESAVLLLDAVQETAMHDALIAPQIVAHAISLALVSAAVLYWLGAGWFVMGLVLFAALGGLMFAGHVRIRAARRRAWSTFGELGRDLRVLMEASAELRAHAREAPFSRALFARVDEMVGFERNANRWSAAMGLLPLAIGVLAISLPGDTLSWFGDDAGGAGITRVGILGGAAFVIGLGLVRTIEASVRSLPLRRTFATFVTRGGKPPGVDGRLAPPSLAEAQIAFEKVSFRYPGARQHTPRRVSHVWPLDRGFAVLGQNGSGKSTLALILLGLLEPSEGAITVDGSPLSSWNNTELRKRIAYLPQAPFTLPGESVAWHIRLLAGRDLSDEDLDLALTRVGLMPILIDHAAREGIPPREVPAGELSGGERQRMHLARVLLQDAELVILDEPEAGVDRPGRQELRQLFAEMAGERRLLLIAHDETIVPPAFDRLKL